MFWKSYSGMIFLENIYNPEMQILDVIMHGKTGVSRERRTPLLFVKVYMRTWDSRQHGNFAFISCRPRSYLVIHILVQFATGLPSRKLVASHDWVQMGQYGNFIQDKDKEATAGEHWTLFLLYPSSILLHSQHY